MNQTTTAAGGEASSIFPTDKMGEWEQAYFEMINMAIQAEENQVISNSKPAHAVFLLHKFFENAREDIRILTGCLAQQFNGVLAYGDNQIAESAIKFLSKENSKLSIIAADKAGLDLDEGQEPKEHPFLKAIAEAEAEGKIKGEVEVFHLDAKKDGIPRDHFLVMDKRALRIETNTSTGEAYVNFNDGEFGVLLSDLFDSLHRRSSSLTTIPPRQAS